jgi:predicted PurR-regulated permease PerM
MPQPTGSAPLSPKVLGLWLLLCGFLVALLWLLAPVLTPFVVAAVAAYALVPLVDWLMRRCGRWMPRWLAVLLVELIFLLGVLGVALLLVPILSHEWPQLKAQLPVLLEQLDKLLQPLWLQLGWDVSLNVQDLKAQLLSYLDSNREELAGSVWASLKIGSGLVLAWIVHAILTPVVLFYMMLDNAGWFDRLLDWVPNRWRDDVRDFVDESDRVLGEYLRGQLLVMLALAVFYSTGLALFGLDLALPIGIFTGLASFVPYVGLGLGFALAALAGLLEFAASGQWLHVGLMLGLVFGLGQLLESFVLTPRLVGERIGLHPLAVILGLLVFGELLGFIGVLVALPASAVALVAIRRLKLWLMQSDAHRS